jgi:acyl-CoA hydrolase
MQITQYNAKLVSASRVTIAQLMQPEHANNLGNVHGSYRMKLVDEAGTLVRMRLAQQRTEYGKARQAHRLARNKRREVRNG